MGHVTWPRQFQGRFVICRLGLAIFNPHIKFEMSTITCNEKIKGKYTNMLCYVMLNVKILVLSHLWGLRGNVHGSSIARWKGRGRLPISAN